MRKLILNIFSLLLLFSCNKGIETQVNNNYKDGLYYLSFDGGLGSDTKSLSRTSYNNYMNLYKEVYSENENLESPETKHYYSEDGLFNWETLGDNNANLVVSVFNKKNGTHLKWGSNGTDLFSKATTTIDGSMGRGTNWADITSVLGISESQISNANYADPVYCFAPYTDSTKISVDPSNKNNLIAEFKMPVSFIYEDSKTIQALKQYSYIYTTTKIAELPTTAPKKFKASESVFKAIPAIIKINLTNNTGSDRTLMAFSIAVRKPNGDIANVFPIKLQYKIDNNGISQLPIDNADKRSGIEIKFRGTKTGTTTTLPTITNNSTQQFYMMILPNNDVFTNESMYFTVTTFNQGSTSFSQYIVKRNQIQIDPTGENKFKSGGIYTFKINIKSENEFVKNYKPETLILKDHNIRTRSQFSPSENYNDNAYISYEEFKNYYSSNSGKGEKTITLGDKSYHTPSMNEFQTIFPVRITYGETLEVLSNQKQKNNFCLNKPGEVLNLNEFMSISQEDGTSKNFRVMADYKTGKYRDYNAMYAIKKKRSTQGLVGMDPYPYDKYRCAYLYFFEKINNNQDWVLRARMKYLGEFSPYTINDIATTEFWDDGTPYYATRSLSCKPRDNNGTTAWYWSTTYHSDGSGSTTIGQEMLCIDPSQGYVGIFDRQNPPSSAMLRLFENN